MNEFDIIQSFFNKQIIQRNDVVLGIGDDGAIVKVTPDQEIVITTDTLVEKVHFGTDTPAYDIGYKSLAVNLSDLAAMGATPAWITLALTMPKSNEAWLREFSKGLFELANRFNIQLIGGDLTHGPLAITIQAHGFVPKNQALRREGAKSGDLIYVTHTLGDAALGLLYLQQKTIHLEKAAEEYLLTRLNRPEPRVAIGEKLRGIAHAAIDISDGLAADLGHLLKSSRMGAIVYVNEIPLSRVMSESINRDEAIALALNGGDDYELCFTAPPNQIIELDCTCIGKITEQSGLILKHRDGTKYTGAIHGYQHF